MTNVVERPIVGAFDLYQQINFGFGGRVAAHDDVLRLAFALDDFSAQVGVAVTQPRPDTVRFEVSPPAGIDLDDARVASAVDQAARICSVDIDARPYDELLASDPVLRTVAERRPGLRPPLFCSAFEGLVWGLVSARRPARQMKALLDEICRRHGAVVEVAGQAMPVVPLPAQWLALDSFPGLPAVKLDRVHELARWAAAGRVHTPTLRQLEPAEVAAELRRLPGVGPFYSELVTVRALGHTDVLPTSEPRVVAATGHRLGRADFDQTDFEEVAEAWRPWRTWAVVGIRASHGED